MVRLDLWLHAIQLRRETEREQKHGRAAAAAIRRLEDRMALDRAIGSASR